MKEVTLYTKNIDLKIAVFEVENPKAIIQIIHGAKEHKERYYEFIKFLNQNGYTVLISDNRGHGASINENYYLGAIYNYKDLVNDQQKITNYIKEQYPNLPLYLFGHSLGSMIARVYLEQGDNKIDKLVLSGTANYIGLGKIGILVGTFLATIKGKNSYSKLLEKFANFLDDTWVVKNKEALEKYRKDPLCNYHYPITSMIEIFKINQELHHYKNYQVKNQELPILSVSGKLDPVTGGEKGINNTIRTLQKIGYKNISNIEYQNMAHEVLNELENKIVYNDILSFFEK